MAFDIEKWKEQVYIRYQTLKEGINRESAQHLYAFLSVSALWPVLDAAQRGDWAAVGTLASLTTANLGTNLLANQIQSWKDEATTIRDISQAAQNDPALRAELDLVLQKLDAIALAEKSLSETDRAWFAETLQKELAQIKSGISYNATLTGSGAIAQGNGAMALGQGATYVGGNYTVNNAPDLRELEAEKRQKALEAYLSRLSRNCLSLPLNALGGEESSESDVTLDKVYIELDTTDFLEMVKEATPEEKRTSPGLLGLVRKREKPYSVLESASEHKRLTLLGDPGAGKSTFVKKLLAWQASACMGKANPPEGFDPQLLPVPVLLRGLSPYLSKLGEIDNLPADRRDDALADAFWDYLCADLGKECDGIGETLRESLQNGDCMLVLDGLDEVPHDLRGRVRQTVDALLKHYPLQRVIVTCRVRSYVGEAVLPQFTSRTLAPFNEEQIQNFVQGWYKAQLDLGRFSESQAQERIRDLSRAALEDDLRELSSNPMLLTTMSIIHQREVGLPRERVRLYNLAVEVLLRRWQKHKIGDAALDGFLKDDLKLRAVMESLAYAAQRASTEKGGTGTLLRKDAIDLLERPDLLGDLQLAGRFLDYVDQRAGLLVGYGGELGKPTAYSFPHRTFQEYLSGAYLAGQRDRVRAFLDHAAEGDSWDLAARLAFEELFYNRRALNELLDLGYQLGASQKHMEQHERASLWAGQIAVLAGRDVISRDSHPSGGADFVEKITNRLVDLLDSQLLPLERAEAGRALGRLGDPRAEVMTLDGMLFCLVPAGKFMMGSKKNQGDSDEQPQHEYHLPDYWIGRYPVSNAQFMAFVASGGYANPAYWQEAQQASVWKDGKVKAWSDDEWRTALMDFGEPFNLPNHPVVGITWYEMLAFTRWLDETWANQGFLPDGWQVTLPNEPQWEKAARGGLNIPNQAILCPASRLPGKSLQVEQFGQNTMPQRQYPWGMDFDANLANTSETGLGTTSAMGCFARGGSPYGVMELSGNVWEWLLSQYEEYPYPETQKEIREREKYESTNSHVLRGGSFFFNLVGARCACRSHNYPGGRNGDDGFRVVLSPLLLSQP